MHYMRGKDRMQCEIISLDDIIPADNPVRFIDAVVDEIFSEIPEQYLTKGLSSTGRRCYSPAMMLKLYLYGVIHRIHSSRRLERESIVNIELRWLLQDLSPDFKTIADFRKDNGELIEKFKLMFTEKLSSYGLIMSHLSAVDSTKLKANAGKKVYNQEQLNKMIVDNQKKIDDYLNLLSLNDTLDEAETINEDNNDILARISSLKEKIAKLEGLIDYSKENNDIPVNMTDPESRIMLVDKHQHSGYNVQLAVDSENHLIAGDLVIQEANDLNALTPLLDKMKDETGIEPKQVVADRGYRNFEALREMSETKSIEVYVPESASYKSRRKTKLYPKSSFQYDAVKDVYICPQKQILSRINSKPLKKKKRMANRYACTAKICSFCPVREMCLHGKKDKTLTIGRQIYRFVNEEWTEKFLEKMKTPTAKSIIKKRSGIVEHVFGTLKTWMGKQHLLLRGLTKVKTEVNFYIIAYNIRRLINMLGLSPTTNKYKKSYLLVGLLCP